MPELRRPTLVLFSRANPVSAILTKLTAGHMALIYKIVSRAEWEAAAKVGTYNGSQVDMADGFIHFSTGAQMRETAAKHFAGQPGLVLVSFDDNAFGDKLVYEPSRCSRISMLRWPPALHLQLFHFRLDLTASMYSRRMLRERSLFSSHPPCPFLR